METRLNTQRIQNDNKCKQRVLRETRLQATTTSKSQKSLNVNLMYITWHVQCKIGHGCCVSLRISPCNPWYYNISGDAFKMQEVDRSTQIVKSKSTSNMVFFIAFQTKSNARRVSVLVEVEGGLIHKVIRIVLIAALNISNVEYHWGEASN